MIADLRLPIVDCPRNETRKSKFETRESRSNFEFRFSSLDFRSLQVNRQARELRVGKRVDDLQSLEPAEVAVSGDEFRDAVLQAQSDNVGVVDQIARRACLPKSLVQRGGVAVGLGKQKERRRCKHFL